MAPSPTDFNAMAETYRSRVYRAACLLLDDPHEAEDVTQKVFVEAWRGWSSFEGRSEPFTWLFTILRRVCARHCRRKWWTLFRFNGFVSWEEADKLISDNPVPDEIQTVKERHFEVRKLLQLLSPRLREVLVLRYIEEYSVRQIADALRIPEGTVKSRINYALLIASNLWNKEMKYDKGE
jgi:RNA polymerase sigma-70 factor (ECF subfamily)